MPFVKYVITLLANKTKTMDKTAVKIITYFNSIEEFLIGILFFTLPFGWTLSIIPLVLFTTTLLVNIVTKPEKPSKEKLLYFLPLITLFLWQTITLCYSADVKEGIETLTIQLAMIVAAIAFLFNRISRSSVKKGFYLFLVGCVSSVLILYGIAIFNSSSIVGDAFIFRPHIDNQVTSMLDSDITGCHFLGSNLSRLVHPAYSALMLSIAMFIILLDLRSDSNNLKNKTFWLTCFALFGATIILFALNGTLILSAAIVLLTFGILSSNKVHYGERSRKIYTVIIFLALLIMYNPQVTRFKGIKYSESTQLRTKVTSNTLELIADNWLMGVGIGDDDTELTQQYISNGDTELAKRKLNPHNQFLSTWLQSGIIGLLLLVWSFIAVFLRARKTKTRLLHLFNVMVIVSFLFESMLLRYWGVITFTIFYGMLYFYSEAKVAAEDQES